jgi:hypothetical protein
MSKDRAVVEEGIRCTECKREVDEFTAIAESWAFWSDGRDLLPYCPTCSEREFSPDAPASEQVPPALHRGASSPRS